MFEVTIIPVGSDRSPAYTSLPFVPRSNDRVTVRNVINGRWTSRVFTVIGGADIVANNGEDVSVSINAVEE